MRSNKTAFVIAALMCTAGIGAVVARPDTKGQSQGTAFSLETMIPKHFGDWREEPQRIVQIVNPQAGTLLDKLYAEVLTRTYVNADGYRIMLSLAYGTDQRGYAGAHVPELCYPAAGFIEHRREATTLATPFGAISVRRLFMIRGARKEPVTYWLRIGDKTVQGWQRRLVELSYTLTGRIPDGMLFRVSSIDPDQIRANQMQDQFITQLLQYLSPAERKYLAGLSDL